MSHAIRPLEAHLTLHITAHATGSRLCFPENSARALFRDILIQLIHQMPVEVHAFAMMNNHLHLLLTSRNAGAVAVFMRRLLATHAMAINRATAYTGQLWMDRYHSVVVDTDSHALHACLYIDANPWRAHMVEHPLDSGWTSHRELITGEDAAFITPHPVLLELGPGTEWRKHYGAIMAEYLSRAERTCSTGRRTSRMDPLAGLKLRCWRN